MDADPSLLGPARGSNTLPADAKQEMVMAISQVSNGFSPAAKPTGAALARNWWAIAIRGVLGIVFGIIALVLPGVTMLSLVLVFSAYALVDGVFAIVAGVRAAGAHQRWGLLILEGIVNILTAGIALLWPGLTVVAFVLVVAAWAILSGGLMLGAAFGLNADHGRWWLALGGIVSVVYGALLVIAPLIGALVLTWWLGAYALIFGASLLALAFRLRARG
jgi:uncharacterized membrane protein HdeD (DUF308 family)